MKYGNRGLLIVAMLCLAQTPGLAAAITTSPVAIDESFSQQEREALDALALADAPLRDAMLEAAIHPNAIGEIAFIRDRSSSAFREQIETLPREEQKTVWELVRYPELIDLLVAQGTPDERAIDLAVEPYPASIQRAARASVANNFDLLREVAQLRRDTERQTADVLSALPIEAQANFEKLIVRPDLMSVLVDHPNLTRRLGTRYLNDPHGIRAQLDARHDERVAEEERALAEWQEIIEEDPEAREELLESAQQYATEEGYEIPDAQAFSVERTEVHHYSHPYPYWFGTPSWHRNVAWYPHRAHWGFGFDLAGAFWVYGLPSSSFSYWHHSRPRHRTSYARLHNRWAGHGGGRHYRKHRTRHSDRHRYGYRDNTPRHRTRDGYERSDRGSRESGFWGKVDRVNDRRARGDEQNFREKASRRDGREARRTVDRLGSNHRSRYTDSQDEPRKPNWSERPRGDNTARTSERRFDRNGRNANNSGPASRKRAKRYADDSSERRTKTRSGPANRDRAKNYTNKSDRYRGKERTGPANRERTKKYAKDSRASKQTQARSGPANRDRAKKHAKKSERYRGKQSAGPASSSRIKSHNKRSGRNKSAKRTGPANRNRAKSYSSSDKPKRESVKSRGKAEIKKRDKKSGKNRDAASERSGKRGGNRGDGRRAARR